ncbi:hypothetical protein [Nocardia macrotermitis]|uniref:Uncharacterized protein n=1 Tax=Nocardia macrotermitis TaxID=2585198 RepID=A0A7K0DE73_9NOCA|nr:hypothetical protein [Nocardia macrotermitis]MQY24007.1 hypothetical protein [Nocardia macrotermitis]
MTALEPVGSRKVVRLLPPPSRTTPRHAAPEGRHAPGPGRQAAAAYLTSVAERPRELGRHRAALPRTAFGAGPAHAGINNYDRMLFWFAGALLSLRIAFVGENTIDEY